MSDAKHVSATGVGLYLTCPACFKRRLDGGYDAPTGALLIGSALHSLVEHGLRAKLYGDDKPSDRELNRVFFAEMESRAGALGNIYWGKVTEHEAIADGLSAAMALWSAVKYVHPLAVEESFELPLFGEWDARGRIDLVSSSAVWDFKSAGEYSRWDMRKAYREKQPGIYGLATEAKMGRPPKEFRFFVATKGSFPSVTRYDVPMTPLRVAGARLILHTVATAIDRGCFPAKCKSCRKKEE